MKGGIGNENYKNVQVVQNRVVTKHMGSNVHIFHLYIAMLLAVLLLLFYKTYNIEQGLQVSYLLMSVHTQRGGKRNTALLNIDPQDSGFDTSFIT